MYDLPELRDSHDVLWSAIAARLLARGITDIPQTLTRHLDCRETWRHSGLLLGQACEYPLVKSFRERLRLVARPHYRVAGCEAGSYRSALVVRALDSAQTLEDLRDKRCVINEPDSNSGMNLLRATIAPLAKGARYFSSVHVSGSHQASAEQVAAADADLTAIDCVTWAQLQRWRPLLAARLRVIAWTVPSPSLPFVTSHLTSGATIQLLRGAIGEVFADEALRPTRDLLLLGGVDLDPETTFSRVLELERAARQCGYPHLI